MLPHAKRPQSITLDEGPTIDFRLPIANCQLVMVLSIENRKSKIFNEELCPTRKTLARSTR
jgi:hypothetical protein